MQSAITSRLGWTFLRPVQELAGHAILRTKVYRYPHSRKVLPNRYALEMVQGYLLDIKGISKLKIDLS